MEPRPLLCNTEAILTTALPFLQGCNTLILDCEGLRLGERGGSLSLVTLRTTAPSPVRTYIIDVVSLPRTALDPVFNILRSSNICKVLFDGRMDYSALYHGHGVELMNTLDVQLVDVASRQTREKQEGQFRRLQKYLPYINFYSNKEAYQQVHKLSGLNECVEEHNVTNGATSTRKQSVDHARWLHRPLPQSYLNYASADVALIHALYDRFMQLRYITPVLRSQSALYITIWKHHQPASYETHLRHPLLPLGILNLPDTPVSTMSCTICSRELAGTAFPILGRNVISERRCWVCRAVAAKNSNNNRRRQYDLEDYFDLIEEQEWIDDDHDFECWDYYSD